MMLDIVSLDTFVLWKAFVPLSEGATDNSYWYAFFPANIRNCKNQISLQPQPLPCFYCFQLAHINDFITSFARLFRYRNNVSYGICLPHCGHWGRDRFLDGHPSHCSRLVGERYLRCGDNDVRGMTNSKEPCPQCGSLYGKTVVCMPWSTLPDPPVRAEEIEKVRRLRFSIALLNRQFFQRRGPKRNW